MQRRPGARPLRAPIRRGSAAGGAGSWSGCASCAGRRRRRGSRRRSSSTASARRRPGRSIRRCRGRSTALARQGLRLGVMSNWDHRLPGLLRGARPRPLLRHGHLLGEGRGREAGPADLPPGPGRARRRAGGGPPRRGRAPGGRRGGGRGGHEGSPSHPQHRGRRPARSRRAAGARRGRARPGGRAGSGPRVCRLLTTYCESLP